MGGAASGPAVSRADVATQTTPAAAGEGQATPPELKQFSAVQIKAMIELYRERQAAIDRSSIRGSVTARRDQYNALSARGAAQERAEDPRPRLDPDTLHRRNHPKGYLTKITNDYVAQQDEEMSVQKGTMVKVLRNHRDGRYEVYTAGGFGLVPGKVLAYVQYEPDYWTNEA